MKKSFKYLVIGGGPSGSAAASLLAVAGEEVCIIEKRQFPREVLCGEFLSTEVTNFLQERGLKDKFIDLNPRKIKSFRLINSDGKEISAAIPFEAYALKRSSLDNLLLVEAVNKGAVLYTPAEVKDIQQDGKGCFLQIVFNAEIIDLNAETVIAAYGKYNTLDRKLGRNSSSSSSGISGIKFHLSKEFLNYAPEEEIRIYAADGIYCGVNPVSADEYTICFLNNSGKNRGNSQEQMEYLIRGNKQFRKLFTAEFRAIQRELKFYGTANLYFGRREKYLNGIYFIGDASGIIAPLAGDGIGIALQSAQLLANHLINGGEPISYSDEWEKLFASRLKTAKLIQEVLLNSSLRNFSVAAVNLFPSLLPYLIKHTRSL